MVLANGFLFYARLRSKQRIDRIEHRVIQDVCHNLLIVVIAISLAFIHHMKSNEVFDRALNDYQKISHENALQYATKIQDALLEVYQNLQVISVLPDVKRINAHAENFDLDSRKTVQALYNNLASNLKVSEIYIVQADIDPTKIDPVTHKPQEPIIMFDDQQAEKKIKPGGPPPQPEDESYEYRQFHDFVMPYLSAHYAKQDMHLAKTAPPLISSSEMITCDNSDYNATLNDEDRKGVIFSVPFYGEDGILKGAVAAIIRTKALQTLLPKKNFALVNVARHYVAASSEKGQQTESMEKVSKGFPDNKLLYSEALPIETADPPQSKWQMWVGYPNSQFLEGPEVIAIQKLEYAGYITILIAALVMMLGIYFIKRYLRTAERLQEKSLIEKEMAETANKTKTDFLANMSHELRTPLNSIIGMAQLMQESDLSQDQLDMMNTLEKSSLNLLEIVNDILDISKIESGNL